MAMGTDVLDVVTFAVNVNELIHNNPEHLSAEVPSSNFHLRAQYAPSSTLCCISTAKRMIIPSVVLYAVNVTASKSLMPHETKLMRSVVHRHAS